MRTETNRLIEKSRFFMRQHYAYVLILVMTAAKKGDAELNFEAALTRLEAIVEEMESGKMMLEDLIVRYEEGMKLVKVCQERLASAEQRIEIITRNHAGKATVKAFEPAVEAVPSSKIEGKESTDHDDVSLF
ncbi:MAG TPA: exodeoxyribonuclease VII small subunit [Chthoniobacterales bacterium]|nr:exodeoxyribonuclease VII small subunit [Chthoniobacterales bacterium]